MRFIIDEQLPPLLASWISARGHEARHVLELDLLRTPDRRISEVAVERDAILVTKDKDFLTWRTVVAGLRVLWLRLENMPNRGLLPILDRACEQVEARLTEGAVLVEVTRDGGVRSGGSIP